MTVRFQNTSLESEGELVDFVDSESDGVVGRPISPQDVHLTGCADIRDVGAAGSLHSILPEAHGESDEPNLTSTLQEPEKLRRHDSYYLSWVVFKVDGCLFRLPRIYFQQHSETFKDIVTPDGQSFSEAGTHDENPINLSVPLSDFDVFLRVLMPLNPVEKVALQKAEWVSVLELAHMWNFRSIRQLAISELEGISLGEVEKILLAHDYDVAEWIHPAYTSLVMRDRALSLDEMHSLGTDFAFQVAAARELALKQISSCGACGTTGRCTIKVTPQSLTACGNILEEVFRSNVKFRGATEPTAAATKCHPWGAVKEEVSDAIGLAGDKKKKKKRNAIM